VIEAGPFTLRPWQPDDTSWLYRACQDPEIQRWTTVPSPYTAGDAATFVRRHAVPQPEPDGLASFAVTVTETGELLGCISFVRREGDRGEIGYWTAAEGRGRGAMPAALDALARWGHAVLGLREVEVRVAQGNTASQRVALKAGFARAGEHPGAGKDGREPADALVFTRPADPGM
jgi:RimJ/RimL family protein N-acetyltransferase